MHIVRGSDASKAALLERIDASQLPSEYGGMNPFVVETVRADRELGHAFAARLHGTMRDPLNDQTQQGARHEDERQEAKTNGAREAEAGLG